MSVIRWRFTDSVTGDFAVVPINPREMSSPTESRNMTWGWGTNTVLRGIDLGADQASEWTFTGVLLTKAHYDLLLAWTKRLAVVHITDHLERTFEGVIQKFDPIERLPTAQRAWRADYTITVLLMRRVA